MVRRRRSGNIVSRLLTAFGLQPFERMTRQRKRDGFVNISFDFQIPTLPDKAAWLICRSNFDLECPFPSLAHGIESKNKKKYPSSGAKYGSLSIETLDLQLHYESAMAPEPHMISFKVPNLESDSEAEEMLAIQIERAHSPKAFDALLQISKIPEGFFEAKIKSDFSPQATGIRVLSVESRAGQIFEPLDGDADIYFAKPIGEMFLG